MTKKRKNVDLACLSTTPDFVKQMLKLGVPPGMYHTSMDEDLPKYERAGGEIVYENRHGSSIVLGRDRNASLASGKGGKGGTHCGSLDLVAGRLSAIPRDVMCPDGNVITGPNFAVDAARVYITQRGNIDHYFALPKLSSGTSVDRSAVALKADHCRVIGRDSVRIFAGGGGWAGLGYTGELNSQGGELLPQGIIELMAGPATVESLQPAVLGNNLRDSLSKIHELIESNHGAIETLYRMIRKVWLALSNAPPFRPFAFEQFAKGLCGSFDKILDQFNSIVQKINYLGLGEGQAGPTLPGFSSILSTNVFLT